MAAIQPVIKLMHADNQNNSMIVTEGDTFFLKTLINKKLI